VILVGLVQKLQGFYVLCMFVYGDRFPQTGIVRADSTYRYGTDNGPTRKLWLILECFERVTRASPGSTRLMNPISNPKSKLPNCVWAAIGEAVDEAPGTPVELSKMSTKLSTVDNCVDNGHFRGHF
jgi:hypothetical protein